MRKLAAIAAIAVVLAAPEAIAQTCPPGDPLCTKDSPAKRDSPAKKDEKDKSAEAEAKPARGVITLAEVTITGRVQKPIAAVDVGRISPHLTLAELRQPFLEKIEQAIWSDPF
jgi:hypothetical protein